jgi:hypothetical protein
MAELARISKANGHGERKMDSETNFERQVRLQQLFQNYVHVVETLNQTGALTLDRIKTALTGRCESTSLISVWEGIIQEKIQAVAAKQHARKQEQQQGGHAEAIAPLADDDAREDEYGSQEENVFRCECHKAKSVV